MGRLLLLFLFELANALFGVDGQGRSAVLPAADVALEGVGTTPSFALRFPQHLSIIFLSCAAVASTGGLGRDTLLLYWMLASVDNFEEEY